MTNARSEGVISTQASEQGARKPEVDFGFASYQDRSFELIARNIATGAEVTLHGFLRDDQGLEQIDKVLPTCVFVGAAPSPLSEMIRDTDDLVALHDAIVTATRGKRLFWIGEILLETLKRETGYGPAVEERPLMDTVGQEQRSSQEPSSLPFKKIGDVQG